MSRDPNFTLNHLNIAPNPETYPDPLISITVTFTCEGISHQLTIPNGPACLKALTDARPYTTPEFSLSIEPHPLRPGDVTLVLYTKNRVTYLANCTKPQFENAILDLLRQIRNNLDPDPTAALDSN